MSFRVQTRGPSGFLFAEGAWCTSMGRTLLRLRKGHERRAVHSTCDERELTLCWGKIYPGNVLLGTTQKWGSEKHSGKTTEVREGSSHLAVYFSFRFSFRPMWLGENSLSKGSKRIVSPTRDLGFQAESALWRSLNRLLWNLAGISTGWYLKLGWNPFIESRTLAPTASGSMPTSASNIRLAHPSVTHTHFGVRICLFDSPNSICHGNLIEGLRGLVQLSPALLQPRSLNGGDGDSIHVERCGRFIYIYMYLFV